VQSTPVAYQLIAASMDAAISPPAHPTWTIARHDTSLHIPLPHYIHKPPLASSTAFPLLPSPRPSPLRYAQAWTAAASTVPRMCTPYDVPELADPIRI
jgi:hypothetical protein